MCNTKQIDDINENNNNNNKGVSCANNKCNFEIIIKDKTDDSNNNTKMEEKYKLVLGFMITLIWIFFGLFNFIFLFFCLGLSCNLSCGIDFIFVIFCSIVFAPIFFIFLLIVVYYKCKIDLNSSDSKSAWIKVDNISHRTSKESLHSSKEKLEKRNAQKNESELSEVRRSEIRNILNFNKQGNSFNYKINKESYENENFEIKLKEERKRVIIQTHSKSCDIEQYEEKLYLINNEEVNINVMPFIKK
jgi:hypothetical protein